ncbi:RDD family protein [Caldalkalibacillus salinus]|uniref:RDD family protein n=1 Tax=Caldalkalibacillus salinus TaxID=2803787 RepID=UPI001923D41D|nr:RDD family protein [Caldalkalibacillus salinus]
MENINYPGGFWRRLAAQILDAIIVSLPIAMLAGLIMTNEQVAEALSNIMYLIYTIVIPLVWYGYTVGKRILGVRIVRKDGSPVSIGTMLLRVLVGHIVYVVTLGIALVISAFMVGLREDKRAIHDMIAGTYVTTLEP